MSDYDAIAETFSAAVDSEPGNALYERPATIALLPPLEGLDVLDAGCGSGFYTEHAIKAGARVVAFDPSGEMVKQAVKRVGDGCEIIHCPSSELAQRLGGRRFDLILSNLVLHYVWDLEAEAKYLADALKPDGRILVSMKHPLMNGVFITKNGFRATGPVEIEWRWAKAKVTHVQRPLGAIADAFFAAGLIIERLVEAYPDPAMETADPRGYRMAMFKPFFIHFILAKR